MPLQLFNTSFTGETPREMCAFLFFADPQRSATYHHTVTILHADKGYLADLGSLSEYNYNPSLIKTSQWDNTCVHPTIVAKNIFEISPDFALLLPYLPCIYLRTKFDSKSSCIFRDIAVFLICGLRIVHNTPYNASVYFSV